MGFTSADWRDTPTDKSLAAQHAEFLMFYWLIFQLLFALSINLSVKSAWISWNVWNSIKF